jgi:hypothetical protein
MKQDNMINRSDFSTKYLSYIVMALVLAVVVYVRIRLLTVPLERDEGEYAYMGQLLLKGIAPFSHAYSMKLPGVSILYALFMSLFGQTPAGIHMGLLLVNLVCIFLVFLLARNIFDSAGASFSCASYAVLSLSSSVNGLFAHATHFVVLFAIAGFLLLLHSIESRRLSLLFVGGACFGLSVIMKQHAVFLLLFAILYLEWSVWRNPLFITKQCITGSALFVLGAVIPYALIVLWMIKVGNFTVFWLWTVQYAQEYSSTSSLMYGWNNFKNTFGAILTEQFPLWLLAGVGYVALGMRKAPCTERIFVSGYVLFSFLATCPGLYFRGHYFLIFLPALALLIAAGTRYIVVLLSSFTSARLTEFIPVALIVAACTYSLSQGKDSFFTLTPLEVSHATYGANPFPEAIQIAAYIKNNTDPHDKIAVLGSEPEIYFYADRLSATGHIYMYGLMEDHPYAERMQLQMIHEIETARPKYIVHVKVKGSWMVRNNSIKSVLHWGDHYIRNLYELVGVIDLIDPKTTYYLWGNEAARYTARTDRLVMVFKRKGEKI